MDLAATCAALLHLMGLGGRNEERTPSPEDPADMGTAYGLEASLAPTPIASAAEPDAAFQASGPNAWLHPH